jgi:hypothetical protein
MDPSPVARVQRDLGDGNQSKQKENKGGRNGNEEDKERQ